MEFSKVGKETIRGFGQTTRYLSSCGGTRSGKTYAILQMLIYICQREAHENRPATINSVVSETYPHLRRGAIRDFQEIMSTEGIWDAERWSATESTYTFPNGTKLEFFSADSPGKVHGAGRDRLFINEAQFIPHEIARQLLIRTRGKAIFDYNPTHSFWLNEVYEPREECKTIHSTYKGNDFLTKEQIAEIESNRGENNWWRVYGLGEIGTLEGLVYTFEQIDQMPTEGNLRECWGMDFGFTHDPTACVHLLIDTGKKIVYAEEVIYRTGMLNSDISDELHRIGLRRGDRIYADCAEPKSIAEIATSGLNITSADKGAPVKSDKLKWQLQWMQGWTLKVTKASVNLINELRNYRWATDRNGQTLDYPIDEYNHALDALRYGLYSECGKRPNYGQYSVHFR